MLRKRSQEGLEDLKRYFTGRSDVDVDEEDVFILASTLEDPLTLEEVCYSTGLKLSVCTARIRRLMESGLLNRFHPDSVKGQKRGRVFVYQLADDIASDLGAIRGKVE